MTSNSKNTSRGGPHDGTDRAGGSDLDLPWADIDVRLARSQPHLLGELRDAVLLDLQHSMKLSRFLRCMWNDVDACVALTMDDFEGMRLARMLRDYLTGVGFDPFSGGVPEQWPGSGEASKPTPDPIEGLLHLMLSDRVARSFFQNAAGRVAEPFLAELLGRIARHKHSRFRRAASLIGKHLMADPESQTPALGVRPHDRSIDRRAARGVDVGPAGSGAEVRALAVTLGRAYGVPVEDQVDRPS